MNLKHIPTLMLAAGLTLFAGGCNNKPSDDSKVLAKVNGDVITEKDFQNYLELRQGRSEPIPDKEQEKKVVLDEMVDRILLSREALDNKLDQDLEVYYLMKRVRENILVQAQIRKTLKDKPVSDEDVRKRYQQEMENTHKTEYKVRHILVGTEDEAKSIINQIKGGANFAGLAKSKSIDTQSGKNGGSLDWVNQGMVVPEFFQDVIALKKGSVSAAPTKSDYGWHIIKVEDSRPLKLPSFDEFMGDKRARANLYRKMQDEKLEALVKDLRAKAKITVN
jgi:peptidyl-prolyl cis-trans isomerase C